MLDYVREGDTLVVSRIDRLAPSTADLLGTARSIHKAAFARGDDPTGSENDSLPENMM